MYCALPAVGRRRGRRAMVAAMKSSLADRCGMEQQLGCPSGWRSTRHRWSEMGTQGSCLGQVGVGLPSCGHSHVDACAIMEARVSLRWGDQHMFWFPPELFQLCRCGFEINLSLSLALSLSCASWVVVCARSVAWLKRCSGLLPPTAVADTICGVAFDLCRRCGR